MVNIRAVDPVPGVLVRSGSGFSVRSDPVAKIPLKCVAIERLK